MKIEIISDVMISGEPFLEGSILEVSQSDANLLIGSNKARPAVEPQVQPEAPKPRSRKSVSTPEAES
ncbi:MAG: hypothetical protein EBY30_00025 [Rhodospirillales bacterium]|nr:hypothetical protein [Rhodospirillales bacterium]